MKDYIGARVDYEPKYKDVLTYFQNIGNLYTYHKMISECTIDMEYAKECEEVIVKWGDYGKRIKDIRAVIAKFPLNDLVENKNYDISSCPYGFEE